MPNQFHFRICVLWKPCQFTIIFEKVPSEEPYTEGGWGFPRPPPPFVLEAGGFLRTVLVFFLLKSAEPFLGIGSRIGQKREKFFFRAGGADGPNWLPTAVFGVKIAFLCQKSRFGSKNRDFWLFGVTKLGIVRARFGIARASCGIGHPD